MAVQFIESMLFGVSPHDPFMAAGVVGLMLPVVLGARWLPVRRAMAWTGAGAA